MPSFVEDNILIKCINAGFKTENGFCFRGLDLEILKNENLFIISPEKNLHNELLYFLAGFTKVESGERIYNNNHFKRDICFLKNDMIYPSTAYDVIIGAQRPGIFSFSKKKLLREHVLECLEKTGAADCKDRKFSELSTGQKRRVLIAKALFSVADTVFLECPTESLDAPSAKNINILLKQSKKTVICSCLELSEALAFADKILYCDYDGYFFGTPEEFMTLYA